MNSVTVCLVPTSVLQYHVPFDGYGATQVEAEIQFEDGFVAGGPAD